jgi:hypothetical protein
MNRFVLQNTFIKVYICYFVTNYKNKKSKLHFGDRTVVLNDFIYRREYYYVESSNFFIYILTLFNIKF